MKQFLFGAVSAIGVGAAAGFALIQSGSLDFAADAPHAAGITQLVAWAREQSIAKRARDIVPPADLASAERIRRGAGNYEAMCAACHLAPGVEDSEIRKGLYPIPSRLAQAEAKAAETGGDSRRFWIIKHGIKGSGMPAWAQGGMDDAAIWDLTAFLKILPQLTAAEYQARVAASPGHSHAGMAQPARPDDHGGHAHSGHAHSH